MIDLGAGEVHDVNRRGDILGFTMEGSTIGQYAVWDHRDRSRLTLSSPGNIGLRGDINERGDVVAQQYLWRAGRLTELVHPLGGPVYATVINDRGVVAGYRPTVEGTRAFTWKDGVFVDFPDEDVPYSQVVDINNRGQALVSYAKAGTYEQAAAVWWRGRVTDLGGLGGRYPWTYAGDINDRGMVIGSSRDASNVDRPFVWQDGVLTQPAGTVEPIARIFALSERGDMVGHIRYTPVLWRDGVPIELAPGRQGQATAVNERGDVAGILIDYTEAGNVYTPFRWRQDRLTTYTLPEGADFVQVWGIDMRGRLACTGGFPGDPRPDSRIWTTS